MSKDLPTPRQFKGVVVNHLDVINAYLGSVGNRALEDAAEKILCAGDHLDHKDRIKNLREARLNIDRAIELEESASDRDE